MKMMQSATLRNLPMFTTVKAHLYHVERYISRSTCKAINMSSHHQLYSMFISVYQVPSDVDGNSTRIVECEETMVGSKLYTTVDIRVYKVGGGTTIAAYPAGPERYLGTTSK